MSDDGQAPDFAMQRAVEILARIFERASGTSDVPPVPSTLPIVLFNETIALDVNTTTSAEVRQKLGIGFSYPAIGWQTYCVRGSRSRREFLSIFYSDDRLISAELYYPKAERAPNLQPVDLHFRFSPGEIALGSQLAALPEHFGRFSSEAEEMGAYDGMFAARFPGGVAHAMGNAGIVERLALYVLRDPGAAT